MQSVNLKKMRFISMVWGFVMFSIVIALTAYGLFYKKQTKEYKNLETVLEAKAQEYVENDAVSINGTLKITKEDLISRSLIEQLEVNNQICDGYIIVTGGTEKINYDSYIKCPKYKTKNYQ